MSANGDAARRDMWAGRIERCLAADMTVKEWCALNKVAESSLCKWMTRFREEEPRPLFPQVERGVELDEGRASRPRAAALRTRSPLPVRWKGDGGAFLSMLRFALSSALAVTAALPAVAPPRVLGGFAGNGR